MGFRDQRRVIRVLLEGKVTEPAYLRLFQGTDVLMPFGRTGGYTPMALVKQARREVKDNRRLGYADFDEIWCVFDRDEHPDVNSAIEEARQSGIETAMSNPCFELWLVLHVQEHSKSVHRHAIQKECQRLGLTHGKAIADGAAQRLRSGFSVAKQRAQNLDEMHAQTGSPRGSNPSTGVWRLVDRL
ncbi:MAG: RloB family protein [Gammaproteobacteria bacterium]|nr:RloB family protein [Gammaproteobacteria bacterium]